MRQCNRRIRGSTVVELAFLLPFFLLLTLGVLHYGWLFYHLHRVTGAARNAARVGSLVGRDHDDVKDAIAGALRLANGYYDLRVDDEDEVDIDDVDVAVDGEMIPGIRVRISLPLERNPHVLLISRIPFGPLAVDDLNATATMAKESG